MNVLTTAVAREARGFFDFLDALIADLKELSFTGPRARFSASAALSVGLATVIALAMHVDNVWWAGISAFMSSQATRPASVKKGALRIIGTVAGALIGVAMASWLAYDQVACCVFLLLATSLGMLGFQLSPHGYAWLLGSITFNLIVLTSLTAPAGTFHFAAYRVIEVVIGVFAAVLLAFLLEPRDGGPEPAKPPGWRAVFGAHWPAALHALRSGVTVMLIPPVWAWFELPSLSQMAITIAAVMAVPAPSDTARDPGRIMVVRAIHRLIGCSFGGLIALVCLALPLTQFLPWLMTLCAGVWVGSHVQASPRAIGYVGTQAAIVFIMTLVQGFGAPTSIWPGLERLGGIFFGLLLLLAVSLVMAVLEPNPSETAETLD
ncbi:conserved membrane hypothetical protein [Methylocella tundrae]|uniref:FUSC family protein n=1 Tax=Methylocella tundrae TaxID=227605 RepID=A0A8B6M250_METTU|nr:FUSC family protein [Methylocella tundrae]VTZ48916.1 conserved membrane hypothetical protein [Methylocella tundrae]